MPRHLFILASHNCGSTLLARLLGTSPNVSSLPKEGQFLDELRATMRHEPWSPDTRFDWEEIRRVWRSYWDESRAVLLEKSPPNLLRAAEIQRVFRPASFLVMVRDPYAFCEGSRRRHHFGLGYGKHATVAEIAAGWVRETEIQLSNVENLEHTLFIRYEDVCDDTAATFERIVAWLPELGSLSADATPRVHSIDGRVDRPAVNLNERQIRSLSRSDVRAINRVLAQNEPLLHRCGYALRPPASVPAFRGARSLARRILRRVTAH